MILTRASEEPRNDDVVVLTEEQLRRIEDGEIVSEGGYQFAPEHQGYRASTEKKRLFVGDRIITTLRDGLCYNLKTTSFDAPTIMHEKRAGTPKSRDVMAEKLFERFKTAEGEGRQVAQEALHMLGYEIDKDVSYTLIDKTEEDK